MITALLLFRIAPLTALVSLAVLTLVYGWFCWCERHHINDATPSSITISLEGKVTLADSSHYQLGINSRIGWFGCWLVLHSSPDNCSLSTTTHFFAKQQFSSQDYARLARCILRNRTANLATKSDWAIK